MVRLLYIMQNIPSLKLLSVDISTTEHIRTSEMWFPSSISDRLGVRDIVAGWWKTQNLAATGAADMTITICLPPRVSGHTQIIPSHYQPMQQLCHPFSQSATVSYLCPPLVMTSPIFHLTQVQGTGPLMCKYSQIIPSPPHLPIHQLSQ